MEITEHYEDEREKAPRVKKYPHAKEVFALFGRYPFHWNLNKVFLEAAEWLYQEKGITELTEMMAWYKLNRKRDFCPQFDDPVRWVNKYDAVDRFFDKLNS